MAIIVEGFDNSGKTTLAESFGLEIVRAGPKPKNWREEQRYIEDQQNQARCPVVLDRVTCLSQPIYRGSPDPRYDRALNDLLKTHHCILIYCRPPLETILDFSKHQVKSYDDQKHLDWLKANARIIVDRYDAAMKRIPHMRYDWTSPDRSVVQWAYDAQFTIGAWKTCLDLMTKR